MALCIGTILLGSRYSFRLVEQLGDKTVLSPIFKAEILPGIESFLPKDRWAVVKSANVENKIQMNSLINEYNHYKKPLIETSENFRKLCDVINDQDDWTTEKPFCLAFEWMDTTFADISFEEHMGDPVLVANIVKVCLEAFAELEKESLMYTDLKPANLFISKIDGEFRTVKIGDLGLVAPEDSEPRWCQPEAFRAPEVWTRGTCSHKADVWSIAALILQRIDPNILGNADNIDKSRITSMSWCLAKITMLVDPYCFSIPPPHELDESLQADFEFARTLTTATKDDSDELLLQIPTFEIWADLAVSAGIPKVVVDVIRLLAVPDPMKRPSALEALRSLEYADLQKAAMAHGS